MPPATTTGPAVVLVTSRSFSSGDLDLAGEVTAAGATIVTGPSDHDLETLRPLLATATAWIAGTGPVTAAHLDAAPDLRVVARYGVGTEAVDLAAAAERGVLVTNTPGANSGAVADLAVALVLAALRDVVPGDRGVRAGRWDVRRARELGGLTVGIVGLGRIGRGVAARLAGFGSPLLGCDPWVPPAELERLGIEGVDLDDLARRSDVVSLHAPGDAVLVDAAFLEITRPGLVLVNTARAALVDEAAVADALRAGRLGAYASDVLASEAGDHASPLLAEDLADQTLFTPHAGAQTVEAVDQMGRGAVDAVLACLRGEQPPNLVRPPAAPEGDA
ncbi:NAD(P)-dependent oxidoreductase [Microlunatus antarcticus]|uniref:D-3-phosphoglycerate dehydrogenase n=1 Tax=Microlunatus antarcticus TaxID=53388 RepID=A0A7W5P7A3_9ACTN|nr:NAD(P)-dependent oxidoreductase [Microlunatus antarcticus]MBB3327217.1 D-3-phosphoglycerate dehydrogenase [Microlunatus antarcticus]